MVDWIQSVFLWLSKQITPWLQWLFGMLKKYVSIWVAIGVAIMAPISWAINFYAESTFFVYQETQRMLTTAQSLQAGNAGSFWGTLSDGAALMNCIVALDYAIAMGTTVFGFMLFILIAKGLVWLYKLVPFKFS